MIKIKKSLKDKKPKFLRRRLIKLQTLKEKKEILKMLINQPLKMLKNQPMKMKILSNQKLKMTMMNMNNLFQKANKLRINNLKR